ncbi:MAG: cytochrome P450 [Proteobacteria bacterium]|nr:cytochrome P450 [Pseudomonadota bacterium]HQR02901.1 cytochrome P450 [Rhodocyclaceae bacterium]
MDAAVAFPDIDFGVDDVPDFHARMDALRAQGERVVPVRYLGQTAWLILRYEDVYKAYRDNENFPCSEAYLRHSEPVQGRTLLCIEGDEHRVKRLLIAREFLPQKVAEYVDRLILPLADELIDAFAGRDEVDLVAGYTRPLPLRLITRLMGIPDDNVEQLVAWVEGLFSFPTDPEGARRAKQEVTDYLLPMIHARRDHPRNDLLSLLANSEVEGQRLTDEDILSFARLIFPAGADTTYLTMGSMLNAVLSDPGLYKTLVEQPELQPRAVEESLRLFGTVALQNRYTVTGCELHGVRIPPHSWVLFGNAPANHEPELHEDPHRFDLGREHHRLVTFGGGTHFCLGSHLARATLRVGLSRLLARLQGLRLAGPPVTPVGAILRGVRKLPATFDSILPAGV